MKFDINGEDVILVIFGIGTGIAIMGILVLWFNTSIFSEQNSYNEFCNNKINDFYHNCKGEVIHEEYGGLTCITTIESTKRQTLEQFIEKK
jgi:hypothetical protein